MHALASLTKSLITFDSSQRRITFDSNQKWPLTRVKSCQRYDQIWLLTPLKAWCKGKFSCSVRSYILLFGRSLSGETEKQLSQRSV